jgi:hypothetical protein
MGAREVALGRVSEARRWIRQTVLQLEEFEVRRRTTMRSVPLLAGAAGQVLRRHFFVDQDVPADGSVAASRLGLVIRSYRAMDAVLSNASSVFSEGAGNGTDAAYNDTPRDGRIYFTPRYLACGPLTQAYVIVHESAHALGDRVQDYTRTPPRRFEDAMNNAYSFSEYAFEVSNGPRPRRDTD